MTSSADRARAEARRGGGLRSGAPRRAGREAFKLEALRDLTLGVGRARDYEESLRLALMVILGTFGIGKGVMFLEEEGEYRARVWRGLPPGIPPVERTRELLASLRAARRPVRIGPRTVAAVRRVAAHVETAAPVFAAKTFCPLASRKGPVGFLLLGPTLCGASLSCVQHEALGVMASFLGHTVFNHRMALEVSQLNDILKAQLRENARLLRGMQEIYLDTIRALAAAIEAKDPYTRGHSERVAKLSVAIAREMGLSEERVQAIHVASILHDIGKIATDRSVLAKTSLLSCAELQEIQKHPSTSYDILSEIRFPYPDVAALARHHHERLDGSGYPDGKRADEIPLGAKVIALADAFDAMVSDRPYRDGRPGLHALVEIRENVDSQFDRRVARSFFRLLRKELADGADLTKDFALPDFENGAGRRAEVLAYLDGALEELEE